MGYGPTDSTGSKDSAPDTTATDTHTTTTTHDAPNLRPMTTAPATEPKPLPPGVERLPSGRFRAKLRDPTRGAPKNGKVRRVPLLALARDLRGAQGRLRARAALSLALEALEAHDRVSQPYGCADSADSADSEVLKCS